MRGPWDGSASFLGKPWQETLGCCFHPSPKAASLRQLPCGRCLRTSPLETALGSGATLGGGYLKTECIYRHKPASFCQADEMIDRYIYFCNHERIQLKTGEAPLARRLST